MPTIASRNCPHCASTRLYRLADGRRMCADCRRRFSIRPRKPRLSEASRLALLQAFWVGQPASQAAIACGVNVKSAQRFYRRVREALGAEPPASEQSPSAHASHPAAEPERRRVAVFGIQEGIRSIRVLMPGEAMRLGGARNATISWVYAPSLEAARSLKVASFFRIPRADEVRLWHGRAQVGRADSFWRFASARLRTYRGGYRHAFGLYLKEMAFRFNARSRADGFRLLVHALERGL